MNLFKKDAKQDGKALDALCHALQNGDAGEAQQQLRKYLKKTISIRDTFARKELKENFYHGMLLGLLAFKGSWVVTSNREAGEGYADILVEIDDDEEPVGIVIEVKYARDGNMDTACQSALEQIENRQYGDAFITRISKKRLNMGSPFIRINAGLCCMGMSSAAEGIIVKRIQGDFMDYSVWMNRKKRRS